MERNKAAKETVYLGMEIETAPPKLYERYIKKYGREKADYLMQILSGWQKHYERLVFIDQGLMDTASEEIRARSDAEAKGWRFEKLAGDLDLIRRLVFGDWNDDFLIVKPGEQITMAFGRDVIISKPAVTS